MNMVSDKLANEVVKRPEATFTQRNRHRGKLDTHTHTEPVGGPDGTIDRRNLIKCNTRRLARRE